MFTPGAASVARLPLTFEIPLSSARATPPCPGSRAFFWAEKVLPTRCNPGHVPRPLTRHRRTGRREAAGRRVRTDRRLHAGRAGRRDPRLVTGSDLGRRTHAHRRGGA